MDKYDTLTDRQVEVLKKYNDRSNWSRNLDSTERNIMSQIRRKYEKAKKTIEEIDSIGKIREYYKR